MGWGGGGGCIHWSAMHGVAKHPRKQPVRPGAPAPQVLLSCPVAADRAPCKPAVPCPATHAAHLLSFSLYCLPGGGRLMTLQAHCSPVCLSVASLTTEKPAQQGDTARARSRPAEKVHGPGRTSSRLAPCSSGGSKGHFRRRRAALTARANRLAHLVDITNVHARAHLVARAARSAVAAGHC